MYAHYRKIRIYKSVLNGDYLGYKIFLLYKVMIKKVSLHNQILQLM